MRNERAWRLAQQIVPPAYRNALDHVNRYGLTITDRQTWVDDGRHLVEYQVNAFIEGSSSTSLRALATLRRDNAGNITLVADSSFTSSGVAEIMTPDEFYIRLAKIAGSITRYGVALDEVNEVLYFRGKWKMNPRTGKYTPAVRSYRQAADVHKLSLPNRLKDDLLHRHCDVETLLTYEGLASEYVAGLYGL